MPVTTLRARRATATVDVMSRLLMRLGDLSAYVLGVSDDGMVTLCDPASNDKCVGLPPPTLVHASVENDDLDRASQAIALLDGAIEAGGVLRFGRLQTACLKPDVGGRWVRDEAATRAARRKSAPRITQPPGMLPPMGPTQVQLVMAELRRDLGELAPYLEGVDAPAGGPAVVRIRDFAARGSLGPALALQDRIAAPGLATAIDAMKAMNAGLQPQGTDWWTPVPA